MTFCLSHSSVKLIGFSISLFCFILILIGLSGWLGFRRFAKVNITLSDKHLDRTSPGTTETYLITDIKKINIKRRKNGPIREIKITFSSGAKLFINEVNDFEGFYTRLSGLLKGDVKVKTMIEPIDFDHHLFYISFGVLVGAGIPLLMSLFASLGYSVVKYLYLATAFYAFVLGGIIIYKRTFSKRFGSHLRSIDIISGLVFIALGAYIAISTII